MIEAMTKQQLALHATCCQEKQFTYFPNGNRKFVFSHFPRLAKWKMQ